MKLSHRDILINAIRSNGPLTKVDLQKAVQIRRERFLKVLQSLINAGIIEEHGKGTKGKPYYYGLAENRSDVVRLPGARPKSLLFVY